ncbi:hypothetical protein W911_13035 [Hyphomicrobium nitrativorans NL23]|uniref:Uncharacterized protein n=1 Tax=Hyphomicrobium nitrativorans NL23 TaxID=1029756 RepID=V5SJL1_9HYPH|nr:hypothetical protein W911_13035 [Hyphomicrobium nitrativorans NL23]
MHPLVAAYLWSSMPSTTMFSGATIGKTASVADAHGR